MKQRRNKNTPESSLAAALKESLERFFYYFKDQHIYCKANLSYGIKRNPESAREVHAHCLVMCVQKIVFENDSKKFF